jgi:hypothetical protein
VNPPCGVWGGAPRPPVETNKPQPRRAETNLMGFALYAGLGTGGGGGGGRPRGGGRPPPRPPPPPAGPRAPGRCCVESAKGNWSWRMSPGMPIRL